MTESTLNAPMFQQVATHLSVDSNRFEQLVNEGKPFILKGTDFGECLSKWNLEYLNSRLRDEQIIIHTSDRSELQFVEKNFKYEKCTFHDFSNQLIEKNRYVYLRTVCKDPKSKRPASIDKDFPAIASDLRPPHYIPYGDSHRLYYSSVLRVASANVQIWTHFDLYDNVLCQVIGHKRIVLFPPEDSKNLYIKGDKSNVNNLDDWTRCCSQFPLLTETKPYKCQLDPGDVIYIPSLWWHNIRTCSESGCGDTTPAYSIGFNIFWRDRQISDKSIYAENDVYGNKNLTPFDAALANVEKAISHLNKLPDKYSQFYKLRLLERIKAELA